MGLVKKAVIPAAGYGTRFLPATKSIPKEMVPIIDKPAIHYVVEEAAKSGIEVVIIVLSRGKEAISSYFDRNPELEGILKDKGKEKELRAIIEPSELCNFIFVRQDFPKGLGHAVLCAEKAVGNETFAVLLPDDLIVSEKPCLMQMMEAMKEADGVIALQRVKENELSSYGIVGGRWIGEKTFEIKEMVEKPKPSEAPSDLAIVGRYILPPAIFKAIRETPPGRGGEIQLTDAISKLLSTHKFIGLVFEGKRFDTGTPKGFLEANVSLKSLRLFKNPWIDPGEHL